MLARRLAARAACLPRSCAPLRSTPPVSHFSSIRTLRAKVDDLDLEMNGYINPTNHPHPLKRQFRDPYYPWWDKQERRDFGEPLHQDDDILGMMSLHEETHMTPAQAGLMCAGFIGCILALSFVVKQTYPDRPSAPREFPDGLEAELGGPHALRARKAGDPL